MGQARSIERDAQGAHVAIGKIASLRRYPVKSTLGESLDIARITAGGVDLDRTHALLDVASGKVVSAKRPQLWRRMLTLASRSDPEHPGAVRFIMPDGRQISSLDPHANQWLSDALGREVRVLAARPSGIELDRSRPEQVSGDNLDAPVANDVLVIAQAAPASGFVDFAPLHVVFAASMRKIAELAGLSSLEEARYRANIVIDDQGAPPFAEHDWLGKSLKIGAVEIRLEHPTPRCAIPTLAHGEISARPAVMHAILGANKREFLDMGLQPCLGLYASVLNPGALGVGDSVHLM